MDIEESEEATVTVNIGGFAFNECGMTKNLIVHTPVPKGFGSTFSKPDFDEKNGENGDDDEETFFARYKKTPTMPTPMAMRDISKKAQESLAALYSKEDINSDDSPSGLKPMALFQGPDFE